MDLALRGRVAVVTGGSKGIGLAVVRTLLEEGAFVVAASRSESAGLAALAGPNLLHAAGDLLDPVFPGQVLARAVDAFGGLDILVNNAGGPPPGVVLPRGPFLDGTDVDWQAIFEFNLFAVMRLTRAALPHLVERGGTIVNVSSSLARQPGTNNYEYSAAKAALAHVSKGLAEEFGPRGVRVNAVSPGVTRTNWWTDEGGVADMFAGAMGVDRDTLLDKTLPEMLRLSTGRFVEPQEVADVVALLASPRSGSVNGADFVVDGGMLKEL
ncbi:SDR family oxidoreductase [Catenulispora sp. NF23]|uniref:SDR family NAD(P)-dependent oxidoreductase n=1 Tax=Catenulispora pinistramenti TaxID=2705254 RepID=UPI001BA9064E|nr:SDR family oxidoreductase [Catenulispora pinistramenti]MBS2536203.1 SDR family oxidoreductase [Catenulispora pinistramenti]